LGVKKLLPWQCMGGQVAGGCLAWKSERREGRSAGDRVRCWVTAGDCRGPGWSLFVSTAGDALAG
jgi:hypothetical protein